MRAHGDGVNLERHPGGVRFPIHMAGFLRFVHRASDHADPFVHDGGDAISHHPAPAIEFKRRGAKKAPPFENVSLHQSQPEVDDLPQPRQALARGCGRSSTSGWLWWRETFSKGGAFLAPRRLNSIAGAGWCEIASPPSCTNGSA